MNNSKYVTLESSDCLDFSPIINRLKKEIRKKFPLDSDEQFIVRMVGSLKSFTINGQIFEYAHNPNHLGGFRWYIHCPKCGRKCLKLYMPPQKKGCEQKYFCKYCHNLKNASSLFGSSRKYQEVFKPLKRLRKLRSMLLKKTITTERAQPLIEEYKRIERELMNSPVYNLYKFQKEHGLID
jgi:hypothetical protein